MTPLDAMKQALAAMEHSQSVMLSECGIGYIDVRAIESLRETIEDMNKVEPTMRVIRNQAGQIRMMDGNGDYFDMSNFVGQRFYTHPVPILEGWIRAIDEELVVTFLGVANATDDYETARKKLNELIAWHIAVATDPAVNGGWQLVPKESTVSMRMILQDKTMLPFSKTKGIWEAMVAAAPKPEDVK